RTALIDVWSYPAETAIAYFKSRVVCSKCGSRGNKIDVRPNWKEQPRRISTSATEPSFMATGPSGKSGPSAMIRTVEPHSLSVPSDLLQAADVNASLEY